MLGTRPRPEGMRTGPDARRSASGQACSPATFLPGMLGEMGQTLLAYWTRAPAEDSLERHSHAAPMRDEAGPASGLPPETKNEANAEERQGRRVLDPAVSEAHFSCVHNSNSLLLFSVP